MVTIRREWSNKMMREMLQCALMLDLYPKACKLGAVEWNELGDWLYYRVNPHEKDSRKNRVIPKLVLTIGV